MVETSQQPLINTRLIHGDDPFPSFIEEFLVVPVRMVCHQLTSSEVVVAEPNDAKRQQERVLVSSGIADGCANVVSMLSENIILTANLFH